MSDTEPPASLTSEPCGSENRFLDTVRHLLLAAREHVYIVTADRSWVFPLMITVIHTLRRGVSISILYYPATEEDARGNRLKLLRSVGCAVSVRRAGTAVPFVGVLTDPLSKDAPRMVVRTPRLEQFGIRARSYFDPADYVVVQHCFMAVRRHFTDLPEPFRPELRSVTLEELLRVLRRKSKFYQRAKAQVEDVYVNDTLPQQHFVKAYKLNQIATLDELFTDCGIELYEPAVASLRNGKFTPIVPPIIEVHDTYGQVVMEGHTRFHRAILQERPSIRAIVFRGVTVDTPAYPRAWADIKLVHDDPPDQIHNERTRARFIERDARDSADWK